MWVRRKHVSLIGSWSLEFIPALALNLISRHFTSADQRLIKQPCGKESRSGRRQWRAVVRATSSDSCIGEVRMERTSQAAE
jgi:hypothetical protein